MNILLRVAAIYSLGWALILAFPSWLPFGLATMSPEMRSMATALAIANLAFAYLFNRAAAAPSVHRGILYAGLMLFGLRGVTGTYEVLYILEGTPAVMRLIDFVLSLALFTGMLNMLPGALGHESQGDPER